MECLTTYLKRSDNKGYNATILAYGQTGTGKAYTWRDMNTERQMGKWALSLKYITNQDGKHTGIIPRVFKSLMKKLEDHPDKFIITPSFIQIYNEKIYDLLSNCNYDSEGGPRSSL